MPCEVPDPVWPRLSAEGFATLGTGGLPPGTWVALASVASAVWWFVPFAFGLVFAAFRSAPPPPAILWFALSLGTFSAVPGDPLVLAVLRTLTLGAWLTVFAIFPTGRFVPRWVAVTPAIAVAWTILKRT